MQIRVNISANTIGSIPYWKSPKGYYLRRIQKSDDKRLPKLLSSAKVREWGSGFDIPKMREYLNHPERRHGSYVIEYQGKLVASCFATRRAEFCPSWGILDYVCVQAQHQGKGLGFGVCAAVLRYFRSQGYKAVTLTTLSIARDNHHLSAIKTYLKLGFLPVKTEENIFICKKIYKELEWPLPVKWWKGVSPFLCNC